MRASAAVIAIEAEPFSEGLATYHWPAAGKISHYHHHLDYILISNQDEAFYGL